MLQHVKCRDVAPEIAQGCRYGIVKLIRVIVASAAHDGLLEHGAHLVQCQRQLIPQLKRVPGRSVSNEILETARINTELLIQTAAKVHGWKYHTRIIFKNRQKTKTLIIHIYTEKLKQNLYSRILKTKNVAL